MCLWCQAAPPGVALGLPSLFCPCRVHAGGTCPSLWRGTHKQEPSAAQGNPAPPGCSQVRGSQASSQNRQHKQQTACRYVCTDLGPSWLRKHSQHSGSNPKCLTETKSILNCLVLCPVIQSILQDLLLILQ